MGGIWRVPKQPKKIFLKGTSQREELRQRPSLPCLEVLLPEAFRLEVSKDFSWLVDFQPDLLWRMAWAERGVTMPHLLVFVSSKLPQKSLSFFVYGIQESVVHSPTCPVASVLQFLFEASWEYLDRVLIRDRVGQMALERGVILDTRDLGRLAKYFRLCLRTGGVLPEVGSWPSLSREAAFDEIGQGARKVQGRNSLPLEERQSELLRCMPKDWRVHFPSRQGTANGFPWRRLQALEEFFGTLAAAGDSDQLLRDPRLHFQYLVEHHSGWLLERLRATWEKPATSMGLYERWMLRAMRWPHLGGQVQKLLGSLANLEAESQQWSTALLDLQVEPVDLGQT
jgi:hypothetical protein